MTDEQERIARQARRAVELTEAEVENLVLTLRRFLERRLRGIIDDLADASNLRPREALKVLGGLEVALEEAGLREQLLKIKEVFAAQYQRVSEDFTDTTGKKALLGDFARENLKTLVDDRVRMAARVVESYVGDVRSVVLDSVIAGRAVKPTDVLASAEGATFRNLETELNTSALAFQRLAHLEKAKKAGLSKFLYTGPNDKVIRPFCKERVGKVFILSEIEQWDNGQDLPAVIYCGGFNCRHHLRPVSDALAEQLQKTENQ